MSKVSIANLTVEVGQKLILSNISLSFQSQKLTCLLGANGAGKTTLIKSICRLLPFAGKIYFNDVESSVLNARDLAKIVAYVPQSVAPDMSISVKDFLGLSRYTWKEERSISLQKVEEMALLCGLQENLNQSMQTLSGGERQRVLITAALVQETPIILLDEITSALDPRYQEDILKLLLKIKDAGKTLIWSTHDINAALLYGDELVGLKNGKLQYCGSGKDFLENGYFENLYDRQFERVVLPLSGKQIVF